HGVVLVMFFYLALTAHRNIVFFVLISAPFVAICLDHAGTLLRSRFPKLKQFSAKPAYGLLVLWGILAYVAVGSNFYYRHVNTREHYGLLVAPGKNPVGGSEFLKKAGTTSGNIYSDYLTSSYFMWENRPGFKTYVDLRDLDVFPAAFMTQTAQELFYPETWEQANARYQFREVILYQSIAPNLHRYLYQHPQWQLVFADAVTAIYQPGQNQTAPEDPFVAPTFREPAALATGISRLFWPVYQPQVPPHEPTDLVASRFYRVVGNYQQAAKRAMALSANQQHRYQSLIELGEIHLEQAQKISGQDQPAMLEHALKYFDQAVQLYPDQPGGYGGQGKIAVLRGDAVYARQQLEKALDLSDKKDLVLYTTMAQAIGIQINNGYDSYFDDWFRYMLKAYELDPENEQIRFIIGQTYCTRGDCKSAEKFLTGLAGYPGVTQQELQQVQLCKMNCRIK
ncbi:MAG TPA: tetratricopeptide repeat protein, partial [Adhaeribacter sp.]|nr:tetratricopeptide repeat protein [Adhaeribacter sp.]